MSVSHSLGVAAAAISGDCISGVAAGAARGNKAVALPSPPPDGRGRNPPGRLGRLPCSPPPPPPSPSPTPPLPPVWGSGFLVIRPSRHEWQWRATAIAIASSFLERRVARCRFRCRCSPYFQVILSSRAVLSLAKKSPYREQPTNQVVAGAVESRERETRGDSDFVPVESSKLSTPYTPRLQHDRLPFPACVVSQHISECEKCCPSWHLAAYPSFIANKGLQVT